MNSILKTLLILASLTVTIPARAAAHPKIQLATITTDKPDTYPDTVIYVTFDSQSRLSKVEFAGKNDSTYTATELKDLTTVNSGSKIQLMPGFDTTHGGQIRFLIRNSLTWDSFENILDIEPDANHQWRLFNNQHEIAFIRVLFHGGMFPDDVTLE